ncbi:MAG: cold-shock protein [Stellaceae bacterium]
MVPGVVRWYADKGYGFIRGDDGADIYVNERTIRDAGLAALREGERVLYDPVRNGTRWRAGAVALEGVRPEGTAP